MHSVRNDIWIVIVRTKEEAIPMFATQILLSIVRQ